jgi:hypothetical protein
MTVKQKREKELGYPMWVLGPGFMTMRLFVPDVRRADPDPGRWSGGSIEGYAGEQEQDPRPFSKAVQMKSDEALIGVTGSTGVVGSKVAARLVQRGVPQPLVVRDVSRAPTLAGGDVARASSYGLAGGLSCSPTGLTSCSRPPAASACGRSPRGSGWSCALEPRAPRPLQIKEW